MILQKSFFDDLVLNKHSLLLFIIVENIVLLNIFVVTIFFKDLFYEYKVH